MTINNAINKTLGNNQWLTASVMLNDAQIRNLFTTPISVVSSPGVGKFIAVNLWSLTYFFNTTIYAGGGNLQLRYTTSTTALTPVFAGSLITAASSQIIVTTIPTPTIAVANAANNGISITNLTAAFTGGNANSAARIQIWYSILDAV